MKHRSQFLSIVLIAVACARPTQNVSPDRELSSLLHTLIVATVTGGGTSRNQIYIVRDSTSAAIMRLAQVPIHASTNLYCPGGTEQNGQVVRGTLGYLVEVSMKGEGETRVISVTKSCTFMFRGKEHGFMQGSDFEIKRLDGHWRLNRQLGGFIT